MAHPQAIAKRFRSKRLMQTRIPAATAASFEKSITKEDPHQGIRYPEFFSLIP